MPAKSREAEYTGGNAKPFKLMQYEREQQHFPLSTTLTPSSPSLKAGEGSSNINTTIAGKVVKQSEELSQHPQAKATASIPKVS